MPASENELEQCPCKLKKKRGLDVTWSSAGHAERWRDRYCPDVMLNFRPVVLRRMLAVVWRGRQEPIPAPWENEIVLRTLWPELPAEAIRVHALQRVRDAALVSVDEFGHSAGRSDLQHTGSIPFTAAPDRPGPT